MSDVIILSSFCLFLALFTAIGAAASRYGAQTPEDYLVAGRNVNPWLVALSAVSTNNSGYMFIGLIGFTWRQGVEAVWITFGWVLGDLLTWFWVHRRVRSRSERVGVASVPALLATKSDGVQQRGVAIMAGIITFLFLGAYSAAQLKAGSTTLHSLFGWPHWVGAVLGVSIVTVYCLSGGIRASIWTDAAQSTVMMVSMALLLGAAVFSVGGPSALWTQLHGIDPNLVDFMPQGLLFGLGLYAFGFVFAGVATIGQPHILVRFMAIESTKAITKAQVIYFVWYTVFSAMAMGVGLYARVLIPELGAGLVGDAMVTATEGALPDLSILLLPPVLIGVMLAGLFSATMSTADSQILSCSAALTQDVSTKWRTSVKASKVATLLVAALSLGIALSANSGVFSLVLIAWAGLGASLGPVLLVRLADLELPTWLAVLMMGSGIATVLAWGASPYADSVYKALPGMLVPTLMYAVFYIGRRLTMGAQAES